MGMDRRHSCNIGQLTSHNMFHPVVTSPLSFHQTPVDSRGILLQMSIYIALFVCLVDIRLLLCMYPHAKNNNVSHSQEYFQLELYLYPRILRDPQARQLYLRRKF